jgi:hypothetical protein
MAGKHMSWIREKPGRIKVPNVRIPRADVTHDMGLVEKIASLVEPDKEGGTRGTWQVPSFLVDTREITVADIENWGIKESGPIVWAEKKRIYSAIAGLGPGPYSMLTYSQAIWNLEAQGKRLPSAGELYYLSKGFNSNTSSMSDTDRSADVCILPDRSRVVGLHSGAWEWTSTKRGGPFTGLSFAASEALNGVHLRAVGCGERLDRSDDKSTVPASITGFRTFPEAEVRRVGARGVRSAKPRRRLEDFAAVKPNGNTH